MKTLITLVVRNEYKLPKQNGGYSEGLFYGGYLEANKGKKYITFSSPSKKEYSVYPELKGKQFEIEKSQEIELYEKFYPFKGTVKLRDEEEQLLD